MATRAAGPVGRALRGSRVLVPLDGSELALRVIDQLLALPKWRELEYVLVEVITSGFVNRDAPELPGGAPEIPDLQAYQGLPDIARARAEAALRLRAVADRLRARGAKHVEAYSVEAADPATAINFKVRELLVDFIGMSTRGSGGIKRFVLGSVAERVVRESEVPVFLVTPPAS